MSQMSKLEAQEFANAIPMEELFSELRRVTGLNDIKFSYKITTDARTDMPRITFESEDLVDRVGFLKLIFESICIRQFSTSIIYDEDSQVYRYWCTIDMDYTHPGGGHNGKTFYHAIYTNRSGWEFEDCNF